MQVSVALLLEYTAPVAVVVWLWLRHGHRPSGLTLLGAAIAACGLVLVLDVISGADLSAVGVLWALGAMVGRRDLLRDLRRRGQRAARHHPGRRRTDGRAGRSCSRPASPACCPSTRPRPTRSTTDDPWRGGSPWSRWDSSPRPSPTSPASRPVAGSAAGWRRSWRSARCSPRWSAPGSCSASCPRAVQMAGGLLVLAGVVVVKLGEGRAPLLVEPLPEPAPVSERPAA